MINYKDFLKDIFDKRNTRVIKKTKMKKYYDSKYKSYVGKNLTSEMKQQIDRYFLKHYGKKVPYIFHAVYYSINGKFDCRYFPENLYIPEFERFMNDKEGFGKTLENKNFLPVVAKAAGVKMPDTLVNNVRNTFFDGDFNIIDKVEAVSLLRNSEGGFIIKPSVDTCGGTGIMVFNDTEDMSDDDLKELMESFGTDWIAQKLIKNHSKIAAIHKDSLQTFRIATYFKGGEIKFLPAIMRIGVGGSKIDNASAGGIFVGILDDGSFTDCAYDNYGKKFASHPDSGIIFKGYKIDHFDRIKEAAAKIHRVVPQMGVVNWDFTIDQDGEAVLIEANCCFGGVTDMAQFTHGQGMFGDDTEEVLRWLNDMEKMTATERKKSKRYF